MSTNNPERTNDIHDDELIVQVGGHPGDGVLQILRGVFHLGRKETPPVSLEGRTRIDTVGFTNAFRRAINFREMDEDLVVTEDPVGLKRVLPDGTEETYSDKMDSDRKKGRSEAVSYGVGRIGKNKFVGIIFNWEFMAATSGVVAGEKIMKAKELAVPPVLDGETKKQTPIIVMCSSGGQRQQEGVSALREMLRTTFVLNQFREETKQPLIFVLVGNTWGGLMASGVPMADVVIGIAGSDAGFAGPGVIEAFEGKRPPAGSQSVENIAASNRNVHVILNNQGELLEYLERTLDIMSKADQPPDKPKRFREISGIYFNHSRYHVPWRPGRILRNHPRAAISLPFEPIKSKSVWDQHKVLSSDPRRPDTLYTLQNGFDGFIPLFSGRVEIDEQGKHLKYPSIVAALAYIDDPRLQKRLTRMVIGNQPGYLQLSNGDVMKEHASPTAWDYRYELKMIDNARRWRHQITSFVDTFGARPRLEDDLDAQYDAIAHCLRAQSTFPFFTSGYLLGVGGSGGHLATDFTADYAVMLEGAQEFVAEPRSAAAILYRKPTPEDIIRTTEGMQSTARFLLSRGLIDKIIREPEGGAQNHPLATVLAIREDIILTELEFGHLTTEEILERREQRIKGSRPIPIGYLNGKPSAAPKSRLRRWLHL